MAIAKNESIDARSSCSETVMLDAGTANGNTKTWRYWAIIVALCIVSLLVALEGTVVSTALPSITQDLGGGETYVWVINAYFLARYHHYCLFAYHALTHSTVPPSSHSTGKLPISSAAAG